MKTRQQGGACVLVLIALVVGIMFMFNALRIVQAFVQNAAVESALQATAKDPEMQSAGQGDVRNAFARRALVSDIREVKPEDVSINREAGSLRLSAEYEVSIPVVANATLVLKFNPDSGK